MRTLSNNNTITNRLSCRQYDIPTGERVTVTIDGVEYERTVHERRVWRNMAPSTLVARFVTVLGTNYVID